jgi:hypothetical protein
LTGFKQGIYYSGVKIYNNLPSPINPLALECSFKL